MEVVFVCVCRNTAEMVLLRLRRRSIVRQQSVRSGRCLLAATSPPARRDVAVASRSYLPVRAAAAAVRRSTGTPRCFNPSPPPPSASVLLSSSDPSLPRPHVRHCWPRVVVTLPQTLQIHLLPCRTPKNYEYGSRERNVSWAYTCRQGLIWDL